MTFFRIFAFAIITVPFLAAQPRDLRTEYLIDPLGIDVAQPRLSWTLTSARRGEKQAAYQVLVAGTPANLDRDTGDLWDSKQVKSPDTAQIAYAGKPLASGAQAWWKVRVWDGGGRPSAWSKPARWSMGLLAQSDWHADFIGAAAGSGGPAGTPLPFPWLRKTFTLSQRPARATVYVNALGYYELYVNGKKVDDHVLSPAVSDYSKRTFYVTHDVTAYLVPGANCVALWLGRGWYVRGHPGVIHDSPLVRAQLEMSMPGGSTQRIDTDTTWKVRSSPITPLGKGTAFGDYGGEHYDARLDLPDWNAPGLNDGDWQSAARFDPPRVTASAQMVEPNRIVKTIPAVSVKPGAPGTYVVDLGRNLVGWLEWKLPVGVPAGTAIRLEYADVLPTGNRFMTFNQRDEYVSSPAAGQVFRSRFNYHGFRYVQITGLDRSPEAADLKGHLIRTAYRPAAEFESSNDLLNRIYRTTAWTYENLTIGGYVVDCPTRERLGYGGDAGTSLETGMFNFDTAALYTKWMANWRDAQHPDGDLPYTAPAYPEQGGGGPMWSGFTVTLPWQLYLQYGDRRILEISYPYMRQWLAFEGSKTVGNVLEPYVSYGITPPQWNFLGDWVTPNSNRDAARDPAASRFINTAHYLYQLQIAAKVAAVLGKQQEASKYSALAADVSGALNKRFFDASSGWYVKGEQGYQAMALLLGIAPEPVRGKVMANLEDAILVRNKGHLDTGMHGTYFLLKQLMEADRNDLIYTFTSKTDYPSWGDMLAKDATTMWESWTGGSHIHDTLISIGSWFIQGIGGIRIDEKSPGFTHFVVKPAPVGDLTFARTSYQSIRGQIQSNWHRENGKFYLDVTVPSGTSATVLMPGTPEPPGAGVQSLGMQNGRAAYRVESGQYRLVSALAK
jgi:alpha-L-rhamnosidase